MNIMTKRGSQDNVVTYEHYCDTKDDLTAIPNDQITLGSTAVVLKDDGDAMGVYMANSSKEWIPFSSVGNADGGSSGGSTILTDLTDVDIANPTDGQTLTYDATAGKWVNGGGSTGGVMVVHATSQDEMDYTLNKTWQEIYDAIDGGQIVVVQRKSSSNKINCGMVAGVYTVDLLGSPLYHCDVCDVDEGTIKVDNYFIGTANGYPLYNADAN